MKSNVQVATINTKSDFRELSTINRRATRKDVLERLYLTREPKFESTGIDEISQTAQQGVSSHIPVPDNVVSLPQFNKVPEQIITPFILLQEWEGYVQTVSDEKFTASLFDLTNRREIEDEEADFSIDDLTEDDKKLLKPGAVFRWLIGYRSIGGTKERISKTVFRRLPQWTKSDFKAAKAKAEDIANRIKLE